MNSSHKLKKVYAVLDLLLICLLVWSLMLVGVAFFDDTIVKVVRTLMGG